MGKKRQILILFIILLSFIISYMVYTVNNKGNTFPAVNKSVFRVISYDNSSTSEGTGFAIESNKILTCYHVVKYATNIVLRDMNGLELTAKLIAYDSKTDLAILETNESVPPLFISYEAKNSSKVVVAHQDLIEDGTIIADNNLVNSPVKFLKILGPKVTYGSSGGPILNIKGQVIGIIVAKLDDKNVTYTCAIPLRDVKQVLNKIKFGEPFMHKDLGVKVQELSGSSNHLKVINFPARLTFSVQTIHKFC